MVKATFAKAILIGTALLAPALLSAARAETLAGCSYAAAPAADACTTAARQRQQCRSALGQLTPAFGPEVTFMLSECQRCAGVYLAERCATPSAEAQWPVPEGMPTPASGFGRELAPPEDLAYAPVVPPIAAPIAAPTVAASPPPAPPLPMAQPEAAPEPDFFDLLFEP